MTSVHQQAPAPHPLVCCEWWCRRRRHTVSRGGPAAGAAVRHPVLRWRLPGCNRCGVCEWGGGAGRQRACCLCWPSSGCKLDLQPLKYRPTPRCWLQGRRCRWASMTWQRQAGPRRQQPWRPPTARRPSGLPSTCGGGVVRRHEDVSGRCGLSPQVHCCLRPGSYECNTSQTELISVRQHTRHRPCPCPSTCGAAKYTQHCHWLSCHIMAVGR